jgi:hypothetical protein
MTESNPMIVDELKRIAKANGGILRAEDIIDAARDEDSVLHDKFEWDDTEAAHQYRLEQARKLARVTVHLVNDGQSDMPIKVFVSLSPDRKEEGGGYRLLSNVMTSEQMRQQLLMDARRDMIFFEKKYKTLKELADVFISMYKANQRIDRKLSQKTKEAV